MAIKKLGGGLIVTGIVGIASSLLVALLLGDRTVAQAIQVLGIEISAVIILLGLLFMGAATNTIQLRKPIAKIIDQILEFPVVTWVMIGFLVVYFRFFISPLFLNPALGMDYFTGYIPNINPIGNDLIVMTDRIKEWVTTGQSPYALQFYPPLTYILFTPLLLFKDYYTLYKFITLFNFVNYCLLVLLLPLIIIDRKNYSLALLFFVTGLFSYGFQFEIERGQYNIFTFLLCISSIYIFHYQPRYRLLAYLLFSISIQLKLYPAIFIVMFIDDWRDWKRIILRFVGLGLFNFMLFFAMGYQIFLDFIRSVTTQMVNPTWFGVWNHSVSAFVSSVKADGLGLVSQETLRLIRHNADWIEGVLLIAFIVLFISSIVISRLRKAAGVDTYLLLACTIGALILPISYDYKLSILAAPMLIFLNGIPEMNSRWHKLLSILLILGISVAYASTLVPYKYRPYYLDNIFPSLFFILISATVLNFLRYRNDRWQVAEVKPEA